MAARQHTAPTPALAGPVYADGLAPLGAAGSAPAGLTAAYKDEAPELAGCEGSKRQGQTNSADSAGASPSQQALRLLDGERQAGQYLVRLQADQVAPDELAQVVSMLYGPTLRGFCRVLQRAAKAGAGGALHLLQPGNVAEGSQDAF